MASEFCDKFNCNDKTIKKCYRDNSRRPGPFAHPDKGGVSVEAFQSMSGKYNALDAEQQDLNCPILEIGNGPVRRRAAAAGAGAGAGAEAEGVGITSAVLNVFAGPVKGFFLAPFKIKFTIISILIVLCLIRGVVKGFGRNGQGDNGQGGYDGYGDMPLMGGIMTGGDDSDSDDDENLALTKFRKKPQDAIAVRIPNSIDARRDFIIDLNERKVRLDMSIKGLLDVIKGTTDNWIKAKAKADQTMMNDLETMFREFTDLKKKNEQEFDEVSREIIALTSALESDVKFAQSLTEFETKEKELVERKKKAANELGVRNDSKRWNWLKWIIGIIIVLVTAFTIVDNAVVDVKNRDGLTLYEITGVNQQEVELAAQLVVLPPRGANPLMDMPHHEFVESIESVGDGLVILHDAALRLNEDLSDMQSKLTECGQLLKSLQTEIGNIGADAVDTAISPVVKMPSKEKAHIEKINEMIPLKIDSLKQNIEPSCKEGWWPYRKDNPECLVKNEKINREIKEFTDQLSENQVSLRKAGAANLKEAIHAANAEHTERTRIVQDLEAAIAQNTGETTDLMNKLSPLMEPFKTPEPHTSIPKAAAHLKVLRNAKPLTEHRFFTPELRRWMNTKIKLNVFSVKPANMLADAIRLGDVMATLFPSDTEEVPGAVSYHSDEVVEGVGIYSVNPESFDSIGSRVIKEAWKWTTMSQNNKPEDIERLKYVPFNIDTLEFTQDSIESMYRKHILRASLTVQNVDDVFMSKLTDSLASTATIISNQLSAKLLHDPTNVSLQHNMKQWLEYHNVSEKEEGDGKLGAWLKPGKLSQKFLKEWIEGLNKNERSRQTKVGYGVQAGVKGFWDGTVGGVQYMLGSLVNGAGTIIGEGVGTTVGALTGLNGVKFDGQYPALGISMLAAAAAFYYVTGTLITFSLGIKNLLSSNRTTNGQPGQGQGQRKRAEILPPNDQTPIDDQYKNEMLAIEDEEKKNTKAKTELIKEKNMEITKKEDEEEAKQQQQQIADAAAYRAILRQPLVMGQPQQLVMGQQRIGMGQQPEQRGWFSGGGKKRATKKHGKRKSKRNAKGGARKTKTTRKKTTRKKRRGKK